MDLIFHLNISSVKIAQISCKCYLEYIPEKLLKGYEVKQIIEDMMNFYLKL